MIALNETLHAPLYRSEFRELDISKLMPRTTRYHPRTEPAIGMFDTRKPAQQRGTKPQTSHVLSRAQIEQAQANRKPANRLIRPYSIATRAIEAMRERGDWITTTELVEMANRHMPETCKPATKSNVYWALAKWRTKGVIESRPIARGNQAIEWRIAR